MLYHALLSPWMREGTVKEMLKNRAFSKHTTMEGAGGTTIAWC